MTSGFKTWLNAVNSRTSTLKAPKCYTFTCAVAVLLACCCCCPLRHSSSARELHTELRCRRTVSFPFALSLFLTLFPFALRAHLQPRAARTRRACRAAAGLSSPARCLQRAGLNGDNRFLMPMIGSKCFLICPPVPLKRTVVHLLERSASFRNEHAAAVPARMVTQTLRKQQEQRYTRKTAPSCG